MQSTPPAYFNSGWPTIYHDPQADYPTPPPANHFHDPQLDSTCESSIGPSRVLTRRQRAALEHAPAPRRPYDNGMQRQPSMYSVSISRPQTPPNHDYQAQTQPQREGLSLNVPIVQPSPNYHPLTPSSSSSPYSTYGFYSTTHSRANSISNSTNPRSASPALSTASALTSVSSSGSGPNSFNAFPTPSESDLASRVKQKKQRLFNVDRKDICLYAKENPNARQEDIARIYGVERSTISKILKNKIKWLNVPADENLRIAKHRPSKFPEIEEDMVKWLIECRDKQTVLSDSMIRNKAKEIARELGIPEERFKASSGWIENFKHRHGVRSGVWTGDGKNARAARALGLGAAPDQDPPLLSPLNPGFDARDDDMMGDDGPPELSPEPEEARVRRSMDAPGDVPIRPSWLLPQHPHPADPAPLPPHPSVPPSRQLAEHAPAYDVMYEAPPRPAPESTTLAEAEVAINKVIHFLDTSGHGILQPHERNVLTTIKCALFQAASGIPYDRTVLPYEQGPEPR